MRLRAIPALAVLVAVLAWASVAGAAPSFLTPIKLTGLAGGEPSIATDGRGNVYVAGPQGIPAGVNGEAGVGFWASHDDGTSFGPGQNLGSLLGGGDSDVITTPDGSVYINDLEATAAQVCKSTDHGATFDSIGPAPDPGHCSNVGTGQAGPSDDRPWLTSDPQGTLYLTYHEFVSAQPVVFRSDNGGNDLFAAGPCGSVVTDPNIEANVPTDITGGTLVAKPITDAAGNLYVLFATTTQAQNAAAAAAGQPSGTFSQLYVAISKDHCKTFTDHTVFDGSKLGTNNTQFGDVFNALTVDGAGNLYTVAAGFVGSKTPFATTTDAYLLSSTDHGLTWRGPTLIDTTKAAHMLPAAAGGPLSGQLAVGFFQTTNGITDPNNVGGQWAYETAQTSNATASAPSFTHADVNPGFLYHRGAICNQGILCSGTSGDRSLADFTSAAIDPNGCPLFTFAGNPGGTPATNTKAGMTSNYVTRQTSDCFSTVTAGSAVPLGAAGTTPASGGPGTVPKPQACTAGSRLIFRISPVPHGRVVRVVAFVNGHRVLLRRGHNVKRISFARPPGRRLNVRIVTTNNRRGAVITRRTFTGCTRTRVRGRTHRHAKSKRLPKSRRAHS